MTPSELRETIESILKVQTDRSILLTGLYLTPDQLRLVRADLEPDDPQVGAIGRDQNVPVFLSDPGWHPGPRKHITPTESYRGIICSYVQMDVVN